MMLSWIQLKRKRLVLFSMRFRTLRTGPRQGQEGKDVHIEQLRGLVNI